MRLRCPSFVSKVTGKLGLEKVSKENSQKIETSNLPPSTKRKKQDKKKTLTSKKAINQNSTKNSISMSSCKFSCHVHLASRKKAASRVKRAKILDSSGKSFKTRLAFADFRRHGVTKEQGKETKKIVPNIPLGFLGSEHEVQKPISCWNSLGIGVSCKYQIHSDTASIATWNHHFEFLKFPI